MVPLTWWSLKGSTRLKNEVDQRIKLIERSDLIASNADLVGRYFQEMHRPVVVRSRDILTNR
jgi:hypothetical protein